MVDPEVRPDRRLAEGIQAALAELATVESPNAVADLLADVGTALSGVEGVSVYLFDPSARGLREAATAVDRTGDAETAESLSSLAREAYYHGAPVVRENVFEHGGASRTAVAHPFGAYGTMVAVWADPDPPTESERAVVATLATAARRQFERV